MPNFHFLWNFIHISGPCLLKWKYLFLVTFSNSKAHSKFLNILMGKCWILLNCIEMTKKKSPFRIIMSQNVNIEPMIFLLSSRVLICCDSIVGIEFVMRLWHSQSVQRNAMLKYFYEFANRTLFCNFEGSWNLITALHKLFSMFESSWKPIIILQYLFYSFRGVCNVYTQYREMVKA